jgi:hypothetical protein
MVVDVNGYCIRVTLIVSFVVEVVNLNLFVFFTLLIAVQTETNWQMGNISSVPISIIFKAGEILRLGISVLFACTSIFF